MVDWFSLTTPNSHWNRFEWVQVSRKSTEAEKVTFSVYDSTQLLVPVLTHRNDVLQTFGEKKLLSFYIFA